MRAEVLSSQAGSLKTPEKLIFLSESKGSKDQYLGSKVVQTKCSQSLFQFESKGSKRLTSPPTVRQEEFLPAPPCSIQVFKRLGQAHLHWKVISFTQLPDSNANSIQKHSHRHTQKMFGQVSRHPAA